MGKIIAGFIDLIGIGMIALPAAIMASGFVENIHERKEKYNRYIQKILAGGIIDENNCWNLEELRRELGLDSDEALRLLDGMMQQAKNTALVKCPLLWKIAGRERK